MTQPVLVVLSLSPYSGQAIVDALNAIFTLATFDTPLVLLLIDDALAFVPTIEQALGKQDLDSDVLNEVDQLNLNESLPVLKQPFKDPFKMMASLEFYDIEDIRYISKEAIPVVTTQSIIKATSWQALSQQSFAHILRF